MFEQYFFLFIDSLFSGLILPPRKEMALPAMMILNDGKFNLWVMFMIAIIANITAATINCWLGKYFLFVKEKKAGKIIIQQKYNKFLRLFLFVLPISFLSIIGNPLCFLGGVLGFRIRTLIMIIAPARIIYYYLLIFWQINIDILAIY
jgi:membrane protein YqaA with SNARE-associated domain